MELNAQYGHFLIVDWVTDRKQTDIEEEDEGKIW